MMNASYCSVLRRDLELPLTSFFGVETVLDINTASGSPVVFGNVFFVAVLSASSSEKR